MTIAIIDTETTGLNPMGNRLVAIGVGFLDDNGAMGKVILTNDSEETLLKEFWELVENESVDKIIGFNTDFDWQFIKLRSLYYRLKIKHFKKYEGRVDLRQILNGSNGRYQKGTKLTDYCRFFGFDIEDDDFKGESVPELWNRYAEGNEDALSEITYHLEKDLDRTFVIYKILVECGLLELKK